MKSFVAKFQLGKQGLTESFVNSVALAFKTRRQIRISVLKSCKRDKEILKEISQELQEKLPVKCRSRIIGFTIILIKS